MPEKEYLRQKAEELLEEKKDTPDEIRITGDTLKHELQVQQIELEIQNEELRRSRDELEETKNKYYDLFNFAPAGYFVLDQKGIVRDINLTGCTQLDIPRGNILNRPLIVHIHHDFHNTFFSHLEKVFFSGGSHNCEIKLIKRNGAEFFAQIESRVLADSSIASRNCRSIVLDITDRKQAERALTDSEARLRIITEMMSDALLLLDDSGQIVFCNRSAETLFGYTKDELIGKPAQMLISEAQRERNLEALNRFRQTNRLNNNIIESVGRRKTGDEFPAEVTTSVIHLENRLHLVCSVRDITEKKQAEEMLRSSQKLEAIGRLAGGIAHDFNNILGSIFGYAEMLQDNPDVSKYARNILISCERARKLVSQMLAFSKERPPEKKPVDMVQLIEEVCTSIKASTQTSVHFENTCRNPKPFILADRSQMDRVLMNICINACQAMAGREGKLSISLSTCMLDENTVQKYSDLSPGDYVKVVFQDNGCGIPPDVVNRVFDPFFTTKQVGQGTGLGLSVAHGIIKNHHGAITVESTQGQGATFTVLLPLVAEGEGQVGL